MSDKAMLVLGEASESDDEDYNNQEVKSTLVFQLKLYSKMICFRMKKMIEKTSQAQKMV